MRSFRSRPVGWRQDSHRHYLAAKFGSAGRRYRADDVKSQLFGERQEEIRDAGLFRKKAKVLGEMEKEMPMAARLSFEDERIRASEDAAGHELNAEMLRRMGNLNSIKWQDKLHGGLGDDLTPFDITPDQLREGVKVEKEHTSDEHIAKELVLDHYAEFGAAYYPELKKMEAKLKRKATGAEMNDLKRKLKHHKYAAKKEPSPDFDRELKSLGQQIAFNRNARENFVNRQSALQSKIASDPSVKYEINHLKAKVEELDEIDRELGEERSLLRERKFESQKPPWER